MQANEWVSQVVETLCSAGIVASAASHQSLVFRGGEDDAWRAVAVCLSQSYPVSPLQLIDLDDGNHPVKHWSIVLGEMRVAPVLPRPLRFADR
jgi:hypothetical protein